MKVRKKPVEVFSQWAETGKDEGMEKNHREAVDAMLDFAAKERSSFSFIDAGCGNGWVVREVGALSNCHTASGVDGSQKMIDKAISLDSNNTYITADLTTWIPSKPVDLVHSMEVFYYVKEPQQLISQVYNHWLKQRGRLIMGLDFYQENTVSHSWPEDCGISIMTLLSRNDWKALFEKAGFQQVETWQVGTSENWAGSLIVTGVK